MRQFPHSVREEYGLECPSCKSDQGIQIYATQAIKVRLTPDGTDDTGDGGYDTEWEDNSRAECGECDYDGQVRDFQIITEEAKERKRENLWRYAVQCCETKLGYEAWKAVQDGVPPAQTPETPANSQIERLWVISGPGHTWWNNDEGWVPACDDATRFPDPEKEMFSLPIDGNWVSLEEVKQRKSEIVVNQFDYPDIPALMNNILWHLERCASEPDGGGAAYMAKELAKLIGRKE